MSPTFRSLHNPNYRRYAAGGVVSNTGTWMQRVAQDWMVLQLTGSGAAIGLTTGLQFLPFLLLSPVAGLVADRIPKRRLLQLTNIGMAAPALVLGLLAVTGLAQSWHVYVLALVLGVASAFDAPARQSFVSELVDGDDLTNAVGLNSASFNAARLVGPAVAGVLIAALGGGVVATGWVILLNAVSYVAPVLSLRSLDARMLHTPDLVRREPGQIRAGLRYVRGRPDLMLVLAIVFFAGTFGLNFQLTSALMATEVFGKGATEYGLLGTFMAVGSLTGSLLAARRVRVRQRLIVVAALTFAGRRDRRRRDADVRRVRADDAAARPQRADHDHGRQHVRAAQHRPGDAGPGDGALHDDLHRRHPAGRPADRVDRGGGRRPLDAVDRRRRDRGRRARGHRGLPLDPAGPRGHPRGAGAARSPGAGRRRRRCPPERCRRRPSAVLTRVRARSSLDPRVWDDQTDAPRPLLRPRSHRHTAPPQHPVPGKVSGTER